MMNQKIVLVVSAVLFSLVLLVAGLNCEVAEANFVPGPPGIVFKSPVNKTYNLGSLSLNVTLSAFFDFENATRQVEYSLDGKENVSVPTVYWGLGEDFFSTVTAQADLPVLTEGSHNLTVYATYYDGLYNLTTDNSRTSHFTIDFKAPYISIISPKPQEYNTTTVALNFTVDKPVSSISYRLDHKPPTPITGNTTLTDLSDGYYALTIYATTASENMGISETVRFRIDQKTPSPSPSPTTPASPTQSPQPSQSPSPSSSPSQTPLPSPSIPEFPTWLIPVLLPLLLASIVFWKKNKQNSKTFPDLRAL
ncbi:MAG: hypothetical protein NWF00_04365 [Candidatus Bathyarchaeota archaeon]|nr:hypothetical protein [Candidatus Bathyarchaeota archaeon]